MKSNKNFEKTIDIFQKIKYTFSFLFNRKFAFGFSQSHNFNAQNNLLHREDSRESFTDNTFKRKSIIDYKSKKPDYKSTEKYIFCKNYPEQLKEKEDTRSVQKIVTLENLFSFLNKFGNKFQYIINLSPVKIFSLALSLRLLLYCIVIIFNIKTLPTVEEAEYLVLHDNNGMTVPLVDCTEYYNNSLNLSVTPFFGEYYGYNNWYERNPLHIFFLWLTHQSLLFQIVLSAFSVALLFKLNKYAGIIYLLYPQHILYSVLYLRLTLLIFLVILSIYMLRNRSQYWLIPIIIFLQIAFGSVMQLHPSTPGMMREYKYKMMDNIWHFWKPSFNYISSVTKNNLFIYLQALPYVALMLMFIKKVRLSSPIFILCVIFSIGFGLMFAHEYHREILMPLIVLYTFNRKYKEVTYENENKSRLQKDSKYNLIYS